MTRGPRELSAGLLLACLAMALGACADNPMGLKPGAKSILESVDSATPAEAVDMALDRYDPDRRYRGTQLLSNASFAGETLYVQLFERLVEDKDPGVRAAAIRGLGLHGSPTHVPTLAGKLTDADPNVRTEAARALQRLHNPVAIDPLLLAMNRDKEPDSGVRAEAARALGQYPEPRVVENLIASFADESLAVNEATASSLRTLTGQDFAYDRAAWQGWYKATGAPFGAQAVYVYQGFNRPRKWWEYLPFVAQPPSEPSAVPTGLAPGEYTPAPAKP